jgi:hypothetical protein
MTGGCLKATPVGLASIPVDGRVFPDLPAPVMRDGRVDGAGWGGAPRPQRPVRLSRLRSGYNLTFSVRIRRRPRYWRIFDWVHAAQATLCDRQFQGRRSWMRLAG